MSKIIGVNEVQLYRYLHGTNVPSARVVAAIAKAGNVSVDWLITGEESDFVGIHELRGKYASGERYIHVPVYDAYCRKDGKEWPSAADFLTRLVFSRETLEEKEQEPDFLAGLQIRGDAMAGLFNEGDIVLLDCRCNSLHEDGVYALRLDNILYVRRLQRQFDGALHIISENRSYQVMKVPYEQIDDLRIIGRIIWAGGWEI